MKTVIVASVCILLQVTFARAQLAPDVGSWGLRASIQGEALAIMLPYRLDENTTLSPVVGLEWVEDDYTQILLGINMQRYLNTDSRFQDYIGAKAGLINYSPDQGDADTMFILGAFFGGEVFLNKRFSLAVQAGVDLLIGDDDKGLFTTTSASITYYF